MIVALGLVSLVFAACFGSELSPPVSEEAIECSAGEDASGSIQADLYAVKASISGTWKIAYGNSRITISEDGFFEMNWDNVTIVNGQYTIDRNSETDYRLTLLPARVRKMSGNQPEFGSPRFDDEEPDSSLNWIQQEIIIDPSNRSGLGLVDNAGVVG